MKDPTSSMYYPLDSDAPSVFRTTIDTNYVTIAFLMLTAYDYVITFDREVEWIWTLRWGLPKFLFFINRYIVPSLVGLVGVVNITFPVPVPLCIVITHLSPWVAVLAFTSAEALLLIRLCALYGHQKLFVRLLVAFYALTTIAAIVNTSFLTQELLTAYSYEFLPGCWSVSFRPDAYTLWIPFAIFDGIAMLLTLYKMVFGRNGGNGAFSLLARDSIVYFVLIFSTLIVNFVTLQVHVAFNLMLPSEFIACISVSRMMMNIRGLLMDDPEHTVYLRTLEFAPGGGTGGSHHDIQSVSIISASCAVHETA